MHYLLEYRDIFDDEVKHFSNYLNGIGKNLMVKFCSHFVSATIYDKSFNDINDVLINWFSVPNSVLANDILKKISNLKYKQISFIHTYNILKIFEYILKLDKSDTEISNATSEVQLFKALLSLNQEFNNRDKIISESLKNIPSEKELPYLILTGAFCYYDLEIYNIAELAITQFIKASLLFDFLENYNEKTKFLLEKFCINEEVKNWKDYLKKYMPLFDTILKSDKSKPIILTVTKNERYNDSCKFLDHLISNNQFDIDDYDFLTTRSKPFYKMAEGEYRIIVPLFTIEKMFNGLFFVLKNINETLSNDNKIKNFRSFYCNNFSEKHLVYEILNKSFPKKFVKLSGQEIKEKVQEISAEPDYYVRNGNKVFLFESKDVLIEKQTKQSNDFRKIESALKTKFYYYDDDGKSREVGIMQLISNIKCLLQNNSKWDKIDSSLTYIYPILLLHYNIYNTFGLNYIINTWFLDALKKLNEEGVNIEKVRNLVIIDINTFILFHERFQNRSIQLEMLINDYNEKAKTDLSFTSFSTYASSYIIKRIPKFVPKLFSDLGTNLFK